MVRLRAGQNIAVHAPVLRFRAEAGVPLELCALVVGADLRVAGSADVVFYNQPGTAGVALAGAELGVTPAGLRPGATAVLLVVSGEEPGRALGAVRARLTGDDAEAVEFAIEPGAGETALICFEIYRRGADWKVRAVGQGYAGGLAALLPAHGVEVDEPQPAPSRADSADGGRTVEVGYGLERLWMIFEDAARSAAALVAARDYAAKRLDDELSAAVSDPAVRNTPAAADARQAAQRRCDELIAAAEADHRRDSEQLMRELADADRHLPPALASWNSPSWERPPVPADGIRLGELYAPDRGALRIPYCVPVPLTRPLWIDTEVSVAVVPVIGALLARLLAADPHRRTRVDVIDLTGAFTGLLAPLAPVLDGPPITDHGAISARLQALVEAAELAEMAYQAGDYTAPPEHRVLLAADFPHGYRSADAQRISALTLRGDLIGLSIVIVGSDESGSPDDAVAALAQAARHLPTVADTPLFDPWTGSAWQLELDLLPRDPQRAARLLRSE